MHFVKTPITSVPIVLNDTWRLFSLKAFIQFLPHPQAPSTLLCSPKLYLHPDPLRLHPASSLSLPILSHRSRSSSKHEPSIFEATEILSSTHAINHRTFAGKPNRFRRDSISISNECIVSFTRCRIEIISAPALGGFDSQKRP